MAVLQYTTPFVQTNVDERKWAKTRMLKKKYLITTGQIKNTKAIISINFAMYRCVCVDVKTRIFFIKE